MSTIVRGVDNVDSANVVQKDSNGNVGIGGNLTISAGALRGSHGSGNVASNTAIGDGALYSNTTGINNTTNGVSALNSNTTGYGNTASGVSALYFNSTGNYNTASGVSALQNNTTGYSNTANGASALFNNTTFSNCSGLGFNSQVTASNQVQLGDSDTTTYVYGTVQNRSDERDKADIEDSILGLEFIKSLRPVSYKWDMREDYKTEMPKDIEVTEDMTDEEKENCFHTLKN